MGGPPLPLTYVQIDLDALAANVRAVKRFIGPRVELIAVVKANAYGHGVGGLARTVLAHGASRLGAAHLQEGIALRQMGISAPILVLGYTPPALVEHALTHDVALTITELAQAERLSQAAQAQGRRATIHVKVDTGMGRLGVLPEEALPFVARLAALPGLDLEGIFSHFAAADAPDKTYTLDQAARFRAVTHALAEAGYTFRLRHLANSAATLDLPETHLDAVRCGGAIFGLRPCPDAESVLPLQPVLALKSSVTRVRTLPAGAGVSYGRTYVTPRRMPIALVPIGYGDGYHRLNSNRGAVLINGRRAPIVGRVTMDQLMVDISDAGPVAVGDEVVLIGAQGAQRITAEEVARWSETINYEVTTSLLPRVPRIFVGG